MKIRNQEKLDEMDVLFVLNVPLHLDTYNGNIFM